MFEFVEFPKISRAKRSVLCTEKIDGTNAQILVVPISIFNVGDVDKEGAIAYTHSDGTEFILRAGSRNRWLSERMDNYGFWKWVNENKAELFKLGPGRHFGEWWGSGIQRRYGLNEKRFSLFNVLRWANNPSIPSCCSVVPIVHQGTDEEGFNAVDAALEKLRNEGSYAAKGFMDPEGIVAFHKASGYLFKATLDNDGVPKSRVRS